MGGGGTSTIIQKAFTFKDVFNLISVNHDSPIPCFAKQTDRMSSTNEQSDRNASVHAALSAKVLSYLKVSSFFWF